ncbi:hypothetical protein K450DRAFT_217509 [Umbelopsis ramanniana AG]|uniref:DNA replication regulator SLD2 n=1 Tax=Umbelopsis ramanniana AG TaxID=1314678 RepID=A0AAD5HJE9_UMBRA|nr:uncharacterized protein K450DRAFT_217509 [Umbelopsis ramanniana AG]KAI8584686.1 hypothetical protein K450DRAFT_217509 [Umbelopsis ramanniana AG]
MTQSDKQLRLLKRRLKEWEAGFLKSHGRKATIKDIAENPSIEAEYKNYRAEKKKLSAGATTSKTDATKHSTAAKRKLPMAEENENELSSKRTTVSQSEAPETPSSGRRVSYQFESPRIKRHASATPTRRHSKVDAFVSSVHGNSPSTIKHNQNRANHSQESNPSMSPARRRQHGVSPNETAKRLLRTPTKLSSQTYPSPKALKSLEAVFQEGESNGKPSLLDLFTQLTEESPAVEAASPVADTSAPGCDESIQFFLEGMVEETAVAETHAGLSTPRHIPRRREKRPGLEGFAPSNSLNDMSTMSARQFGKPGASHSQSTKSSQPENQSLSPLSFRIARPSTGGIKSNVSPSAAKTEDIQSHIMPGFYSSLASTQNSRRLLISPDRRQRLLRQLSDHGGIGNVLLEDPNNAESDQEQLLEGNESGEDNVAQEVWKKKPIQKRQTRRYKSMKAVLSLIAQSVLL